MTELKEMSLMQSFILQFSPHVTQASGKLPRNTCPGRVRRKHLRSILYWLDFHGHNFWASFKASPWLDLFLRHDPLLYDTSWWTKLSVRNFLGREELTPLRTSVLKTPLRTSAQWLSEEEKNMILGNPC